MGYETEEDCNNVSHYIPLLYSTLLVGVTILLSGKVLVKWKYAILSVGGYFLAYAILKIGNWDFVANYSVSTFLFEYKSILLVGIVVLPIIYQMFVYWLYSSIYKGYLKYHAAFEYKRFQKSIIGIKTRDKFKVDKIYYYAWNDAVFASNEDSTLTSLYNVLNQQLLNIASPSYSDLLTSWLTFHWKKFQNRNNDLLILNNSFVQDTYQQNVPYKQKVMAVQV